MAQTKLHSAQAAQRSSKRATSSAVAQAAGMTFAQPGPAISATEALNRALEVSRFAYGVHDPGVKKPTKPVRVTGSEKSPGQQEELGFLMQRLKAKLHDVGVVSSAKVRLRPPHQPERRLNVEFYPDPADKGVVFLRLSPAGPDEGIDMPMVAGTPVEQLVTPQEVAEMLGVSRPYAAKLCDSKVFGHVDVSQGGHRKVALSRVRAYVAERKAMSTALDEMAELTRDAQAHDAAKAAGLREASGKVWVKTKAAGTR